MDSLSCSRWLSSFKWTSAAVLLAFFVLASPLAAANNPNCKDPAMCGREDCSDTIAVPPKECHEHVAEMECFRVCKDPAELLECFKERETNGTEEYCMMKYRRKMIKLHDKPTGAAVSPGAPLVLKGREESEHGGIPCSLKCRVNPVFWSCVHRCDATGCYKSFQSCETDMNDTDARSCANQTVVPKLSTQECLKCYVSKIIDEMEQHPDCIFRYPTVVTGGSGPLESQCTHFTTSDTGDNSTNGTQAYKHIEECITRLTEPPKNPLDATAELLEECYRLKLVERQMELCQSTAFAVCGEKKNEVNTAACQDQCLVALTKPLCYVPCPRDADLELQWCEERCTTKWPVIDCTCSNDKSHIGFTKFMLDVDSRVNAYLERIKPCEYFTCALDAIYDEVRPQIYGLDVKDWSKDVNAVRNCKSVRFINEFGEKYGEIPMKITNGLTGIFRNSHIGEITRRYTFYECAFIECIRYRLEDAYLCINSCLKKERSNEEIDLICGGKTSSSLPHADRIKEHKNPYRAVIVLHCLLVLRQNRTWDFNSYIQLSENQELSFNMFLCEVIMRGDSYAIPQDNEQTLQFFTNFAKVTYSIESEWCENCLAAEFNGTFHPDALAHYKCEYHECYKERLQNTCTPLKDMNSVVKAHHPSKCSWQLDYSLTQEPYKIWGNYFDEIPPIDETQDMVQPNALKYLVKSNIGFSKGHYAFPYFLVLRPKCEDGFYDNTIYQYIASGAKPVVSINYEPLTSREPYVDLMSAKFQGMIVNLNRTSPDDMRFIPMNPLNRENGTLPPDGKTGCHFNLCYPAFLVPQIMLHIPIFKVSVSSQQTIDKSQSSGYSATLHLRDESGKGRIKTADKDHPPTADEFFPVRKIKVFEDLQFIQLWDRLPDKGFEKKDDRGTPGPEMEHLLDHQCNPFTNEFGKKNPHAPLDSEDFFHMQYTHGNSPIVILAGFYDPNLVIIGDPDMNRFELVRWQFDVTGGSKSRPTPHLFHEGYPCFSPHFKVRNHIKPMYSLYDRLDSFYWLEFYRMRFKPKNYADNKNSKSIFSAVTLEDRILFVTTSGIVTLYHNYNTTASLGKAWEVEAGDRLKKCFKIVRTAKRAHPKGDTIVAITYDYQVQEKKKNKGKNGTDVYENYEVSQQVWVGTYQGKAQPIKWQELTSGLTSENLKEERVFNEESKKVGTLEDLPDLKIIGIPVQRRETNPKSQIEAICYKAYRSNMGKAEYIELLEDQGWCDAIDATPVVSVDQKIQVLVRMKVYYSGGTKSPKPSGVPRIVILYVVASFNTDKSASQASIWQINAIIPRIPCQDEHRESIPSIVLYNAKYFRKGDPDIIKHNYGCHTAEENADPTHHIYLHGMTYTRSYNQHLFLYGSKLLQSTDGGLTFVQLGSFPDKSKGYLCMDDKVVYHRIKLMAFDDLGHYAFLTNKRELWYGHLGSLTQIRLRPGPAHSMSTLRLPEVHDLSEGVPFTVFFDSKNDLVEMVAVVNENGTVSRIARRSINERTIIRARFFLEKLKKEQDSRLEELKQHKIKYIDAGQPERTFPREFLHDQTFNPLDWSVFCPFASPKFYHNFSKTYARTQNFYFPAPQQHYQLGNFNVRTSLYTYQAVTFNLIWYTFFNKPSRLYSFEETEQFKIWIAKKRDVAVLSRLTFLDGDPAQDGILVIPDKYRRLQTASRDANRIYKTYYMDYGVAVKIIIMFSVANDYNLNLLDYEHHRIQSILLNVDNANGTLIQINTDKQVLASKAAVKYDIVMSVKKNTGLPQSYSGRDGIQVPIKFHLIGGFGNCIVSNSEKIYGDSIATTLHIGCPPSLDLVFDWGSTLKSIKFRDQKAHFGQKPSDCYEKEKFCFFMRYPLTLYFHVFDSAKQLYHNYTGKYIMRITGGGYSQSTIHTYSAEDQQAFNIPGVSDVSLIWTEWDRVNHQKIDRGNAYEITGGRNDSREVVLQAGVSSIHFGCHTLSPCARITPRENLETVYYFKVFVTNRGVDNDTLCLFEKEFLLLLYGFPPSPEIQLVTSVFFYTLILTILYIAYLCLRSHKKMWRSTSLKFYGWFQVIKQTLPKSWFKAAENEEETEQEAQKRKDEILLSLQGHLNVPKMVQKEMKAPVTAVVMTKEDLEKEPESEETAKKDDVGDVKRKQSVRASQNTSASSLHSGSSGDDSHNYVIDPLSVRPAATTWTDLVYEQIISRRLAAILEKNKEKAEEKAREQEK